jgi:hypothetical protein
VVIDFFFFVGLIAASLAGDLTSALVAKFAIYLSSKKSESSSCFCLSRSLTSIAFLSNGLSAAETLTFSDSTPGITERNSLTPCGIGIVGAGGGGVCGVEGPIGPLPASALIGRAAGSTAAAPSEAVAC